MKIKTIDLNGDDIYPLDAEVIAEIIAYSLANKGINVSSFSWKLDVSYSDEDIES